MLHFRVVTCGRALLGNIASEIARCYFELREAHQGDMSTNECQKLEHSTEMWVLVARLFGELSDEAESGMSNNWTKINLLAHQQPVQRILFSNFLL